MLKKEARILGISATTNRKTGTFIVGAIFRGSSWLDGMLVCTVKDRAGREVLRLSKVIMKSRQYSQLHAVIISKNQNRFQDKDIAELARSLKLPVILLLKRAPAKKRRQPEKVKKYDLKVNDERLQVCAKGISLERTQELFTVGCAPDSHVPDAVRVADLVTKQGNWKVVVGLMNQR